MVYRSSLVQLGTGRQFESNFNLSQAALNLSAKVKLQHWGCGLDLLHGKNKALLCISRTVQWLYLIYSYMLVHAGLCT